MSNSDGTAVTDGIEVIEDDYDPFEEFDRNTAGMGTDVDNYAELAAFRKQAPIIGSEAITIPGEDGEPVEVPAIMTVYGNKAVLEILRDNETFSSAAYDEIMGPVMGHALIAMDEPEHHRYRSILQKAFTRKEMERWETSAVIPIIDARIDAFIDNKKADLIRELLFPFPVEVIAKVIGLPEADLAQFHRWAVELISVSFNWERGVAASGKLRDYLQGILDDRRNNLGDDTLSVLATAENEGQKLTDEEIFSFLRLLLPAGAETTYRSSSNLLTGLLTHPDQLEALIKDRSLMGQAIEEALRWEPPLLIVIRTATKDTVVDGVPVPKGAFLILNLASANHDEKVWEDPETFNIFREPKQHLAFAFGVHMCLGLHLARMETKVALNRLFDRLPGLRLDPDADYPTITGNTFRAPRSINVIWD